MTAFKFIVATGTLIGMLAQLPASIQAGESPSTDSAESLLPSLKETPKKIGAPVLPPPDQDLGVPEGLRALKRVSYKIQPGDTLTKVLENYGVAVQDRRRWLQSIQKNLPLSAFR